MKQYEEILSTVSDILKHIQEVEMEISEETKTRTVALSSFFQENNITPSSEVLEGIQYQDILSQKLSATTNTMSSICSTLEKYLVALETDSNTLKDSIESLDGKLKNSLEKAKERQVAFSGLSGKNESNGEDEIEFF